MSVLRRSCFTSKPCASEKGEIMGKQSETPLFPFWAQDRGLSFFLAFLIFITIFVPMVRLSQAGRIAMDLIFALMLVSGAIATIRQRILTYLIIAMTVLE